MGSERRARGADAALAALCWGAALVVVAMMGWMAVDVLGRGAPALSWTFLIGPVEDAGRAGGVAPILLSTLGILAVSLVAVVPVGLGAAVYLAEWSQAGGHFAPAARRSVEVLAGVPSVVFGLFGNALFCEVLGLGFSIVSGGLTLACMALPIFVRAADDALRAVPEAHRRSAGALGLGRAGALFWVIVPAATPGLVAALVLAVGRALAETAALIFTSGYVTRNPESLLDSGRALSVHIYDLAMNVAGGEPRANASALVLVALLLVINGAAGCLTARWRRQNVGVA